MRFWVVVLPLLLVLPAVAGMDGKDTRPTLVSRTEGTPVNQAGRLKFDRVVTEKLLYGAASAVKKTFSGTFRGRSVEKIVAVGTSIAGQRFAAVRLLVDGRVVAAFGHCAAWMRRPPKPPEPPCPVPLPPGLPLPEECPPGHNWFPPIVCKPIPWCKPLEPPYCRPTGPQNPPTPPAQAVPEASAQTQMGIGLAVFCAAGVVRWLKRRWWTPRRVSHA